MAAADLVALIKAKQSQMAKLQAELAEAHALLSRLAGPTAASRSRNPRRRSVRMLDHSPTAREAAQIIRAAGRPQHVNAIVKAMRRRGRRVAPATVVSALSRWVRSRAVFYRSRPNVFGLLESRKR